MIRLLLPALVLAANTALAQPSPQQKQLAQEHFAKATIAYNLGRFDEAIADFTKAYEVWPQPAFLYNIAQAHRLAGRCKDALYFYKRFRALMERGDANPLRPERREELDRFINELSDCAARTDAMAQRPPDTIEKPVSSPAPAESAPTEAVTQPKSPAAVESANGEVSADADTHLDAGEAIAAGAGRREHHLVVGFKTGVSTVTIGALGTAVQPRIAAAAAFRLTLATIPLELGAGFSYTPLPYDVVGETKRATLLASHAFVASSYLVTRNTSLRGELAVGLTTLSGLTAGNPLARDQLAAWFVLPSVRASITGEYVLLPELVATISPIGISYSSGSEGMTAESVRELDFLVGLAYRR